MWTAIILNHAFNTYGDPSLDCFQFLLYGDNLESESIAWWYFTTQLDRSINVL